MRTPPAPPYRQDAGRAVSDGVLSHRQSADRKAGQTRRRAGRQSRRHRNACAARRQVRPACPSARSMPKRQASWLMRWTMPRPMPTCSASRHERPLFLALPGNAVLAERLAAACRWRPWADLRPALSRWRNLSALCRRSRGQSVVLVCTLDRPTKKSCRCCSRQTRPRELGAQAGRTGRALSLLHAPGHALPARRSRHLTQLRRPDLPTLRLACHGRSASAPLSGIGRDLFAFPPSRCMPALSLRTGSCRTSRKPYLIGPDRESSQWIEAVAGACGAPWAVLTKTRTGDRSVSETPLSVPLAGRTPILLDDIVSSGATILEALRQLPADAEPAVAVAIHALCSSDTGRALTAKGTRLVTTNSVPNPAARIDVVPLLADGVRQFT